MSLLNQLVKTIIPAGLCGVLLTVCAGVAWGQNLCSAEDGAAGAQVARGPASQKTPDNGVVVIQFDRSVPVERLRGQGYRIKTYEQFNASNPWRDPSPKLRNDVFRRVGLLSYINSWDELEKDMLFLRAQDQNLKFLVSKYAKLPRPKLVQLKRTIASEKRGGR